MAEAKLAAAAVERGAPTVAVEHADEVLARFAAAGRPLGVDQAAAVRGILTSGAQVEVLAAAAGTGKSFTVGVLAKPGPTRRPGARAGAWSGSRRPRSPPRCSARTA